MKAKRKTRRYLLTLLSLLLVWGLMIMIDYRQVFHAFEKPIFARLAITADDGGSGVYKV